MRAITLALGIALIVSLSLAMLQAAARDFTSRFSTNDTGDIVIVANALVTCSQTAAAQDCAGAQDGTETGGDLSNNNYSMVYVDADSDGSTFNSSSATFTLPTGATVLFAGLYWGGDSTAGGAVAGLGLPAGSAPPNASLRNQVKFATPASGGYVDITASAPVDFITGGNGDDFQGFADVTSLVQAGGSGQYMVGNVQAGTGPDRQAGWALVVAFRDSSLPPRNLTVFDGLRIVQNNPTDDNIDITVSGFQTPPEGAVLTSIGVVAYEGDRGSAGDDLRLNNTILTDANNPSGNFFNSTVSSHGTSFTAKSPSYNNQLGFDADIVEANGLLANNATSATINLTTGGETYLPGVVTFVTQLYAPDISAPKSVVDLNGGNLAPGDLLEYTIVVTNSGQDSANTVIATDPIPTHTTYEPESLQIDGVPKTDGPGNDTAYFDGANNRAVFHIGTGATAAAGGTLASNGGSATLKLRVRVNQNVPNGTTIANQAHTSYTGATSGTAFSTSGTASTATISQLTADLTLSKQSTPVPFVAGEPFSYTIVASNLGPDNAPGATIADTLPTELAGFTWTCSGSGGATCATPGPTTLGATPTISTTADLPSGGSVTIVVTGTLPPSTSGGLTNTATITPPASVQDPVMANNTGTDVNPGGAKADLRVSKTSSPNAFVPGDTLTYTIVVSNAGPSDAPGARVRDQLDAALGSFTWTCTAGPGAACQTASGTGDIDALVDLPVGTTATFTITGEVPASYTAAATNTATIDPPANVSDPVQGNNLARSQNPPGPQADLSIVKTQTPDPHTPGGAVTYTLLVQNHGPSDATNARVQDVPPGEVSNVTWTCAAAGAGASCGIANGVNVIDALVTLPAGTSATFTISGTVAASASGVVINTATVKEPAGVTDPVPGSNESSVPSGPAPVADLSVVKTASINPYVSGLPVSFTIVVSNAGPSDALNARVQDMFPPALSGFTWTCAPSSGAGTCDVASGAGLIDTFVDLPAGSAVTFTVSGTVPPDTTGPLTNTVTVTPPLGVKDPDPNGNQSSVTLGGGPQADLQLTKTSTPNPYVPGTPITYTIVATNAGPSSLIDGHVQDGLPAVLQNITWTCAATNGACPAPSGTGHVDALVDIVPGGNVTFTVTADVPAGTRGTLVNAATILPPPGMVDATPNNNTGVDYNPSIPIPGPAELKITQEFPSVAPPNGLITFRLRTQNYGGSSALNQYITGLIPPGTTFVSATPSAGGTCNIPGNPSAPDPVTGYPVPGAATEPLRCTWPGLTKPGDSHFVEFTVRVAPGTPQGQILWSCFWTWSETDDPYHANNVVDAYLFVHDGTSPVGDLSLQAGALSADVIGSALPALVGEPVPIRFWVTNHGPVATRGQYALILDSVNTIQIVDVKLPQGWVSPSGPSSGVWDTGLVQPGQTVALDLTVRVLTPGAMELFAQRITGSPGDPNATNEHAAIVLDGYAPGFAGRWVAVGNVDGAGAGEILTGAGQGETPQVRVFTGTGADTGLRFFAYEQPFTGGVQIASCDVNGDGVSELITAPGPGRASTIRVLSLVGGVVTELTAFDAFEASFTGGASVACADLDADGSAEVVIGAGPGRAPEVQVYSVGVGSFTSRATFLAYEAGFLGGVRVAAGVYPGRAGWLDAFAIATTPGAGRAAELRLFTPTGTPVAQVVVSSATKGVLPTLGDVNGDGQLDLLLSPDDGRPELVRIFEVDTGEVLGDVQGGLPGFPVGIRTAVGVLDGGPGQPEIVIGNGPGGHPRVRVIYWPPAGPTQRLEILPLEIP